MTCLRWPDIPRILRNHWEIRPEEPTEVFPKRPELQNVRDKWLINDLGEFIHILGEIPFGFWDLKREKPKQRNIGWKAPSSGTIISQTVFWGLKTFWRVSEIKAKKVLKRVSEKREKSLRNSRNASNGSKDEELEEELSTRRTHSSISGWNRSTETFMSSYSSKSWVLTEKAVKKRKRIENEIIFSNNDWNPRLRVKTILFSGFYSIVLNSALIGWNFEQLFGHSFATINPVFDPFLHRKHVRRNYWMFHESISHATSAHVTLITAVNERHETRHVPRARRRQTQKGTRHHVARASRHVLRAEVALSEPSVEVLTGVARGRLQHVQTHFCVLCSHETRDLGIDRVIRETNGKRGFGNRWRGLEKSEIEVRNS